MKQFIVTICACMVGIFGAAGCSMTPPHARPWWIVFFFAWVFLVAYAIDGTEERK